MWKLNIYLLPGFGGKQITTFSSIKNNKLSIRMLLIYNVNQKFVKTLKFKQYSVVAYLKISSFRFC